MSLPRRFHLFGPTDKPHHHGLRERRAAITVPAAFRAGTLQREGEAARDWLEELPHLAEELLRRWDCVPDGPVTHGWVAMIVPARRATGDAAVLKVSYRHPGNVHEPIALEAWQGNGAVRLLERADESYAMLLERGHPETLASLANVEDVMTTAGALNARLTSSSATAALSLRDQAAAWALELQQDIQDFPGALPARVTDQAAETLHELGSHQPDSLIHGDFHPGNILRADREPWLAIDPKGFAGDPGYDAAVMMRWRLGSFLREDADPDAGLRRALRIYCEAAGVDLESGRLWTQLIAVQASYWGRRHGFETARTGAGRDRIVALADHVAASFCAT